MPHLNKTYTWLITGAAGFIGRHLTAELLARGQRVVALDRHADRLTIQHEQLQTVQADAADAQTLNRVMQGADFVLHHAALSSVSLSVKNPQETLSDNFNTTLAVLNAARQHGVQRVIFASSSSVYGPGTQAPHAETNPLHPLSPYALSKMQGEELARLFYNLYAVPTVCLRYFNVYGPGQPGQMQGAAVIARFLHLLREGQPVTLKGDGLQSRDFIHIKDVARANILAALHGQPGQCYNVASGQSVTLVQLVTLLEQLAGRELPKQFIPGEETDIRFSSADVSKFRALGFEPRVTLEEGLRSLFHPEPA